MTAIKSKTKSTIKSPQMPVATTPQTPLISISSPSIPKILLIKGAFKHNCVPMDEIFEQQLLESINETVYTEADFLDHVIHVDSPTTIEKIFINYDKLPTTFKTLDAWPKSCNLLCWYCNLTINSSPVFIPKVIEPIVKSQAESPDTQHIMSTYGAFCSFPCAKEFIELHYKSIMDRVETLNKLKFLHKLIYKCDMKEIINYPSPYDMHQYGGNISADEYHNMIKPFSCKL